MAGNWRSMLILFLSLILWLGQIGRGGMGSAAAIGGGQPSAFTLPPPADAQEACRLSFYAYDSDLPLHAEIKPLDQEPSAVRYSLSYDSVHDQRVTAILALPRRFTPPYPAVLLVHGSGGSKDTSYIHWSSSALTAQGYATLSIDTQYHGARARPDRSGEIHMPDSFTMRDAWVQTVVDLRRAVDYLETRPDIHKDKIGYLGFSQGAMLGAVLGGVEARIHAFCLAVPGGGFVNIVQHIDRYPVLKAHWPVQATPEVMRRVEEISNVTDPIYYIGRIPPRPLLIIVAKYDEIIPPEASEALVEAARAHGSVQVQRWDSGHVLNPNTIFGIRDFFVAQFGKS
ncbi:MAG TPA: acetylxylan esterase [Chthonomonadaceae bacterium]|nr:acetylxylan esterase [Chthonomonadaceae bacterium]